MILKRSLPLIFLVTLLASCKTVSYLSVDLADPSAEQLPGKIQSLTLVNRAADLRYSDDPADTIQLRFYQKQFDLDTVILDVHAADTLLQALGNLLFESGRFDIVIPENRFLMKDSLNEFSGTMNPEQVKKLTEVFETDALLSLEYFKTGISAKFGRMVSGFRDFEFDQVYIARMKVGYTAVFRFYDPDEKEFMSSYLISDTLIWEDTNPDIKALFRNFTSVKTALAETGIAAALNLSERIAPQWNRYKRAYFEKGNPNLVHTGIMVRNNDWISARQIWLESLDKARSKSLRSKLEFNIALASEMLGELDEAIRWGVKSYYTSYRPVTYNYLNTLKQRKSVLTTTDEKKP